MPGNIRRCAWVTRDGKRRRIRLYEAWCNLRGRLAGGKSVRPYYWNGLPNEFYSWERFREWAIKAGYRKGMTLDRINPYLGYTPDNCQWLTNSEHAHKTNAKRHETGCPCEHCRRRRMHHRPYIPSMQIDPECGF